MIKLERVYRSGAWTLNLTGFSMLFLAILVGGWTYSGSPFPKTTQGDRIQLWALWSIMLAIVVVTALLWLLRLTNVGRNRKR